MKAVGKKRGISQKSVMNGKSATKVAEIFGWDTFGPSSSGGAHRAEWLHRSAFSFGGLGFTGSNNSQNARNLIFGSVEANTLMMRHENTIKRIVRRLDKFQKIDGCHHGAHSFWECTGILTTTTYPLSVKLQKSIVRGDAQWLTKRLFLASRTLNELVEKEWLALKFTS
ncbi:unnamed protein product [Rhizoctonia solani]|uniref:Uncharacterized protein n=1 Tax=Rhizoctonia solani TaxID=456999 RepID=A0A8H3BVU6_9AGAM|nr:unnamed protein product [Rhizoctonia solani]